MMAGLLDDRHRRRFSLASGIIGAAYVSATAVLAVWVVVPVVVAGWDPVVVTTGSMQPALGPGDVVLLETVPDGAQVSDGAVITFRDPRDPTATITHRVVGQDDAGNYATRGDANRSVDSVRVPPESVVGVGRVLVPFVGLPVVWLERGDFVSFLAWAIATIGLTSILLSSVSGRLRGRVTRSPVATEIADAALRRLRTVVALLVVAQLVADPEAFAGTGLGPLAMVGLVLVLLGGTNLLSVRLRDLPHRPAIEMAVDASIAVLLAAPAGSGSLLWILLSLPIAEAAARYRVNGAILAWITVALATVAVRAATATDAVTVVDELDRLLDQLGILLLITLPGAFLAEQLLVDIARQQEAEAIAVARGELLHVVAEAGQRVSTVDLELMSTVIATTISLGFDRADVVARGEDGWEVLRTSGPDRPLPSPKDAAGGLVGRRLHFRHEVDDADPLLTIRLRDLGLGGVLVHRLSSSPDAALRVGVGDGRPATIEQLEALDLLVGQARVGLENEQLVSELRSARSALERQALTDALTGLPNRAAFHRFLDQTDMHVGRARVAVLFCDLDGFKAVNDGMGHDAGDALLVEISRRLGELAAGDDLVARLGGDEFVMVARRSGIDGLERLAEEIVRTVAVPVPIGDDEAVVGTSVGVAVAEHGVPVDELIRRADAAMYAVKTAGKRGWRMYDDSLEAEPRRALELRNAIRTAIGRSELVVEYQPVVAASPGPLRILFAEALLRWDHPTLGRIGPLETLAAADDAGLRDEVEDWVLRTACSEAVRWQVPGLDGVPVSVNLGPSQLARTDLAQVVTTTLAGTGLNPTLLVLELSEEATVDAASVLGGLSELRDRGVLLALDDFGMGAASLATLRGVALDILKLDKSFMDRCETVETERRILASVTSLAQDLGLAVVAEGVERHEQLTIVRDCGIELVQGYLAFRPLPAEHFAEALHESRESADDDGDWVTREELDVAP